LLRDRFDKPHAETIALDGLAFLAGRPEDMERFLRNSGLDAGELKHRAADPDMLRAVLEFLLQDDEMVTGFCRGAGLEPKDLHLADHVLSEP
jgi:hypothetical protein